MYLLFRTAIFVLLIAVAAGSVTASFTSEQSEKRGMPLRWRDAKVKVAISASLTSDSVSIKPGSDVAGAISRSLEIWSQATGIEFSTIDSEKQNVSPAGLAGDGTSLVTISATQQNLSVFGQNPLEMPATTRIFFDRNGYITEADIVLNPTQQFSTDGTLGTFDLEAVLAHEVGHLLGLEHSLIAGSIMYPSQAKNGHFAMLTAPDRRISAADLSALRAIYGELDPDVECCYRITGDLAGGKFAGNVIAWAEDPDTGELKAESRSSSRQEFEFDGLTEGRYRVYLQGAGEGTRSLWSGLADITAGKPEHRFSKVVLSPVPAFDVQFIGTNGQLSKMPLVVERGKSYRILLAGKGLDSNRVAPGSTSPFIIVSSESGGSIDYGKGITALSFEITIDPSTPPGIFTLFAGDRSGNRSYFPGSLVITSR